MDQWLLIYRAFTDVELAAERVTLLGQIKNFFNAQTEGNRSYARSTREASDRLAALTQVQAERGGSDEGNRHMVADFSRVQNWG